MYTNNKTIKRAGSSGICKPLHHKGSYNSVAKLRLSKEHFHDAFPVNFYP